MHRIYHKCHFCGDELIAVIKNVPAGVCKVCGEQYFKADIVKEMERLVHSKKKSKKMIRVPLRELTVA